MRNEGGRPSWFSLCTLHLALCTGCLAGCTALPSVAVRPQTGSDAFRQTFDRAYVTRSEFGEDQVVLVNAPIARQPPAEPARVIRPLDAAPLHTVMAVRLHWRPTSATLQTRAGLNAVLHWYVYGRAGVNGPVSLLHYVGTGFATLTDAGDGCDVAVSHGSLSLAERYGDLRDPLGAFTTEGTFHAVTGPTQLAETLADVATATADATATYGPATTRP